MRPGDRVVERDPFYLLGPNGGGVGEVVALHEDAAAAWVRGLRRPGLDAAPADWRDPMLFDLDELRPYRPRSDKAYFLRRQDQGFLREKWTVEASKATEQYQAPGRAA